MQWQVENIHDQWGIRGECLADEPLAPLTTWRAGGSADLLVRPRDMEDVHALFVFLRQNNLPWLVLGGGSNVLIGDNGVRGVVIQLTDMDYIVPHGECQLRVGAGCRLSHLVAETVRQGYAGFEYLAGIPGTVGGAVVGNAGALGQQIGDCVLSAPVAEDTAVERWTHDEFDFAYRHSALGQGHALLEVVMQYRSCDKKLLRQRLRQARQHRAAAQAVVGANAGSVFKNPAGAQAWKLIVASDLSGRQIGDAMVSPQHANFIVNRGQATAADIVELMAVVQQEVEQKTGCYLEPEVRLLGDFGAAQNLAAMLDNAGGRV